MTEKATGAGGGGAARRLAHLFGGEKDAVHVSSFETRKREQRGSGKESALPGLAPECALPLTNREKKGLTPAGPSFFGRESSLSSEQAERAREERESYPQYVQKLTKRNLMPGCMGGTVTPQEHTGVSAA